LRFQRASWRCTSLSKFKTETDADLQVVSGAQTMWTWAASFLDQVISKCDDHVRSVEADDGVTSWVVFHDRSKIEGWLSHALSVLERRASRAMKVINKAGPRFGKDAETTEAPSGLKAAEDLHSVKPHILVADAERSV